MSVVQKGSCLCGAVAFEVAGGFGGADACHCAQCRKWTGHFLASVGVTREDMTLIGGEFLSWHEPSEKARRGFCSVCGSSISFDPLDKVKHDWIGISMGAFDTPLDIKLDRHIFVAEKGGYYDLDDGLPQNDH